MRIGAHSVLIREGTLSQLRSSDALICCPDNFTARALLNRVAISRKQPLVNGGTEPFSGDATCYVPGRTPCLDCSLHIEALAHSADVVAQCHTAQVSTVTSNAIIGAIMVWMLRNILTGQVPEGIVEYDGSMGEKRIGVRAWKTACNCHESNLKVA